MGYSPRGLKESDMTERLMVIGGGPKYVSLHFFLISGCLMSDSIWMKSWCYSQPTSPLKHLQSYPQPPSQMSDHLGYAAVRLKGELPGTGPGLLIKEMLPPASRQC